MISILKKLKDEMAFVKGNLLVLLISWMFFSFGHTMAFPYQSPYMRGLGASPFMIGIILAIGYITLTIVRIPGSYIADHYGRKQIIALMTFAVSFSYIIYAIAPDWRLFLIGMIMENACLIYQPALEAITADSIPPEKRGIGFALTQVVPNIPTVASPAIAAFLVGAYGLISGMRIVYLIIFIFSLAAALTRWSFLKETLAESSPIKIEGLRNIYKDAISSIVEVWRTVPKSLKILTIVIMISSFEDPTYMQFSSLYVFDKVGLSENAWGLAVSLYLATTLIVGIPTGKLIDKIGRKKGIILSYLLFIPGTIIFVLSKNIFQVAIALIILAIGSIIIGPAFQALIADLSPREKRGRIIGVVGTLNIIAISFSAILAGALYQITPELPFIFTVFTGSIVASIVAVMIKEPEEREE